MTITTIDLADTKKRRTINGHRDHDLDICSVIALDPGGDTGWSLIVVAPEALCDPEEKILGNVAVHQHGEISSYLGNTGSEDEGEFIAVDILYELCDAWPDAAIVCEDFILRQKRKDRDLLSPVRMTARMAQLLTKSNRRIHRQSAADAKTTCSDDRLKAWGLYTPLGGLKGHARDADRHALLFLRKAKSNPKLRAEAWPFLYGKGAPYER